MIAMLTGTLARVGENDAVISVGGVGYQFQATSRCLARLGGAGAGDGVDRYRHQDDRLSTGLLMQR